MNTGTFVIDPAQSNWTTTGSAELSTGFLGELIARITILAEDGEEYSEYWLRADVVDQRIEYLCYSELEGAIIRDGTWTIEDVEDGPWRPSDDAEALAAFTEMTRIADGPAITALAIGMELDSIGVVDEEVLAACAPLWSPAE